MRPLAECPTEQLSSLNGLLADIDDTITTDGKLTADAYSAMEQLRATGLRFVPITGRPAGWCDHIARMWPVDAVVGENGAFWFRYDHNRRTMSRWFAKSEASRRSDRSRLHEIGEEILREVPGASISADQLYREADLAIDFCEDIPRLPEECIERIVEIMKSHGMTVKVSSIHVNGWFGTYDKLSTTLDMLSNAFGGAMGEAAGRYAYIGDSPNDEPMFRHFDCTVGVANVADFAARMQTLPRYVTIERGGSGFAEFVRRIVCAISNR